MDFPNQNINGQMHKAPQRLKFGGKQASKEDAVILGHSQLVLQTIWKEEDLTKLINPEGLQILRNIYEPLPLGGPPVDYYFKEDYTIVPKPRAVVYRDRNDQRKLMRLNELHKFSDGTLTRVMEKLDQMVKDFHLFEYNKGMETRKWSEDDKRRSKDFITAIEKRLQIRRIYRSLESFIGGRIRDIDYRLINRTT
ncbi:hypothetical protein Tco_1509039 [Tanacetum coccineum]